MLARVHSMWTALSLAVTSVVVAAIACGSYFFVQHHYAHMIESARATALQEADLVRLALEHQMLENRRDLVREMVEDFGQHHSFERVLILDRFGRLRFSSAPGSPGEQFSRSSPTCRACHDKPPAQRPQSVVISTEHGQVLRTVLPIHNQVACHRCHDPAQRINGVLIVDVPEGPLRAALDADTRWFAIGSGALGLALLVALTFVLRLVVVRRLRKFESAARAIAAGDLTQRVPVGGDDTVAWLAQEFNAMAEATSGLLREVQGKQEQLERVINSVDDGIVVLDRDRQVVAANNAFLDRAGVERQALIGRTCGVSLDGLCRDTACPAHAAFASQGRRSALITHARSDGSKRFEEVRASPIHGPDGSVLLAVEVWRDITERRLAEARLSESHRLASLGLLASGFSHEMNTPLASTLTCVEGIVRSLQMAPGDRDWQGALDYAEIARSELLRCRGITQQFLRLSRGQAGDAELVEARPLLDKVARLVEPTAKERGVTIRREDATPPGVVRGNDGELQQVLLNLLLNAIFACGPGGVVKLGTGLAQHGGEAVLRVADNGCGIPDDARERLFEPFFSRRPGGTGLGLFLSQNIVRSFGGEIRVDSRVGEGSVFEVLLAAVEEASAARGETG